MYRILLWTVFTLIAAPLSARDIRDVQYAARGGTSLKLDVHVPDGKGPFPIAILVHGGGNKGDKQSYVTPLFSPLSAASFTWFTIDYRPAKSGWTKPPDGGALRVVRVRGIVARW